ncbi:MAG: MarR family winged helix-turn-helix transcriptional regulator, partial [Aquisalinus sp.]|nr:MarR family winged helix-turn-helix transcriptional regulator [Aquisalinus sp.]
DKGIVSRAVKTLIDLKLVVRKSSASDGRISHLFLSAKGEELYATISAQVRAFSTTMERELSQQEREIFIRMLRKLSESF